MDKEVRAVVNLLMTVIRGHQGVPIMCLVKSEGGLEVMGNTGDPVIRLGMVEAGRMMILEDIQGKRSEEVLSRGMLGGAKDMGREN